MTSVHYRDYFFSHCHFGCREPTCKMFAKIFHSKPKPSLKQLVNVGLYPSAIDIYARHYASAV